MTLEIHVQVMTWDRHIGVAGFNGIPILDLLSW